MTADVAATQAGILAAVLACVAVLVCVGYGVARPWLRTRDERMSLHTVRAQMSLLRTTSTPFQVSDGLIGTGTRASDGVRGAGSDEDANRPIMRAVTPRDNRGWSIWAMRRWALWSVPRHAIVFLLFVEVAAVLSTFVLSATQPVNRERLEFFGAIVALGIVAAESTRGIERMRRRFSDTPHVNMSSVWTLSAALLTTPVLAAATSVLLYSHLWARSWYRIGGAQPFRVVFNISGVVLACLVAGALARALPGGPALPPASVSGLAEIIAIIAVYSAVNSVIAAGALGLLRNRWSPRELLGSWQENSVEYATLCVGIVAAGVLTWRPWLVVLLLLPLYVLHRSVLIRQLEHAAVVDEMTGLLNAETWHTLAATEVERARRRGGSLALLMADLDHFTMVNETFGHGAGDDALRAVADAMRQEVKHAGVCGRIGGEEFAILLANTEIAEAAELADRVCRRVRALRVRTDTDGREVQLSVSIGAAAYPDAGADLDEVLLAADNALFAAKDAGRGRARAVRVGTSDG